MDIFWVPFELGDLKNVDTDSTAPADGQALVWDDAAELWIPGTVSGSSPLTSKGDLYTHSGSTDARLPVGANGQVLTADSGSPIGIKWGATGGSGRVLLSEQILAASASQVDFTSISSGYISLVIEWELESDRAGNATDAVGVRFGDGSFDAGSNYSFSYAASTLDINQASDTKLNCPASASGATAAAGVMGHGRLQVHDYTDTTRHRQVTGIVGIAGSLVAVYNGAWLNTSGAIDRVRLYPLNGSNFIAGSKARLYGLV